jgi:hypothetical protein
LRWLALGLCIWLPGWAAAAPDQAEIEAAFVYNFAKFVEWPASVFGDSDVLLICVPADNALAGKLGLLQGREAQGHVIRIRVLGGGGDANGCHILFVSASDDSRGKLLHGVGGLPVLTISDAPGFAQQGGMIGLFVESNHIQFAINRAIAEQSGLKLSARMLLMARIVQSGER